MQEREVVDEYKRNSVFWTQLSSSTRDLGLAVTPKPKTCGSLNHTKSTTENGLPWEI